jgi:ABC-type Fe3+ transport system permease subunit
MRANNPDRGWAIFGLVLAAAVALPMAAVVWKAFAAEGDFLGHLAETVLPRYIGNTLWIPRYSPDFNPQERQQVTAASC